MGGIRRILVAAVSSDKLVLAQQDSSSRKAVLSPARSLFTSGAGSDVGAA